MLPLAGDALSWERALCQQPTKTQGNKNSLMVDPGLGTTNLKLQLGDGGQP
jgi:hypothetical protein